MSNNPDMKMMTMEHEKKIFPDSDEAARYTQVEGWVSRTGRFFGPYERSARYDGATHIRCDRCSEPIPRQGWVICRECLTKREVEKYAAMDKTVWDETTPLYSLETEEYYHFSDEVDYYLEDHGLTFDEMRFLLCIPMYLPTVNEDHFRTDILEDLVLPDNVRIALIRLNTAIEATGPVGWEPGRVAVKRQAVTEEVAK